MPNPSTTTAPLPMSPGQLGEAARSGISEYAKTNGAGGQTIANGNKLLNEVNRVDEIREAVERYRQASATANGDKPFDQQLLDSWKAFGDAGSAGGDLIPFGWVGKGAWDATVGQIFNWFSRYFDRKGAGDGGGGSGGDPGGGEPGGDPGSSNPGGNSPSGSRPGGSDRGSYPPSVPIQPHDPLILDLNRNGISLFASGVDGTYFDIDNDGFAERVGWIESADGLLVRDVNLNGSIDNITELFGNDLLTGHADLRQSDGNADGTINAQDAIWTALKVWVDANSDGVSQAAELKSLEEAGIRSISLVTNPVGRMEPGGQVIETSVLSFSDGTNTIAASVNLNVEQAITREALPPGLELNSKVYLLPNLAGLGRISDLYVAMTRDPSLSTTGRASWSSRPRATRGYDQIRPTLGHRSRSRSCKSFRTNYGGASRTSSGCGPMPRPKCNGGDVTCYPVLGVADSADRAGFGSTAISGVAQVIAMAPAALTTA